VEAVYEVSEYFWRCHHRKYPLRGRLCSVTSLSISSPIDEYPTYKLLFHSYYIKHPMGFWLCAFLLLVCVVVVVVVISIRHRRYSITGSHDPMSAEKGTRPVRDTPLEAAERLIDIPYSRERSERKLPYRDRRDTCHLSIHSGQRKLLIMETEFLTQYGKLAPTVVYAGAAPGIHIRKLAEMFPDHHFHLYDPRPFSKRLESLNNVTIHNEYFTDEVASSYSTHATLFICDVRSGDSNDSDFESHIVVNMQSQSRWTRLMRPVMALLKFRLPFTPGTTEYLDGKILLQPWAPTQSTECRLITNGSRLTTYDHTDHEQRMYRHNIAGRLQTYNHNVKAPGVDRCYDCTTEVRVLSDYLDGRSGDHSQVAEFMNSISEELGESLDLPPHGTMPNAPLAERLVECDKRSAPRSERKYTANRFKVQAV